MNINEIKPEDKVRIKDVSKLQCKLLLINYAHLEEFEVLEVQESDEGEKVVMLVLEEYDDCKISVLPILEHELQYLELV
ncbi:hypothetical protein M3649_03460 [Ureibacillus chungkukjangi]|uniref:hypothetical protein n=1 Tax=Ureibacillus chungkukjangi TaxID=1202712 RepID=UPI002041211C|nr:hypothetical protein [Ureibacillus chungkukjangi]MCM3387187.1 hypothetical protein [Ureibacillus chungkukjangi]